MDISYKVCVGCYISLVMNNIIPKNILGTYYISFHLLIYSIKKLITKQRVSDYILDIFKKSSPLFFTKTIS